MYVLNKHKENQLKIVNFTAIKIRRILHRLVIVMSNKPLCINEPRCEKTGLRGFRLGSTQTRLHSHRR